MKFPKSILVIKYLGSEKNLEGLNYIPLGITSVEIAKKYFWEEVYELFEIETNGDLRLFKELGVK